jgi:hypothetical protein
MGIPHPVPRRRRANRRRGHGTFADDYPSIAGVVGRQSGGFCSKVLGHVDGAELEEVVDCTTLEGTTVNTDEWREYIGLDRMGRVHETFDHRSGHGTTGRGA